ncbi:MAG TPA: hypothetical protein VMD49_11605 [Steroidobacteraceae bacterium]|nr:hypothetical protein [Steroidobacteraceae bacterium]
MPPTGRTAHKGILWLVVGSLLGFSALEPAVLRADDAPGKQTRSQTDDADLMEFLGGIGSEDENLIKFLGRTDPRKVAAASVPKRPPPTGAQSSSADPGGQKQ